MIPTIETEKDAKTEHIIKNIILSNFTFTPCINALFSPCCNKHKSFEKISVIKIQNAKIENKIIQSFIVAIVNEPVIQKVI